MTLNLILVAVVGGISAAAGLVRLVITLAAIKKMYALGGTPAVQALSKAMQAAPQGQGGESLASTLAAVVGTFCGGKSQ